MKNLSRAAFALAMASFLLMVGEANAETVKIDTGMIKLLHTETATTHLLQSKGTSFTVDDGAGSNYQFLNGLFDLQFKFVDVGGAWVAQEGSLTARGNAYKNFLNVASNVQVFSSTNLEFVTLLPGQRNLQFSFLQQGTFDFGGASGPPSFIASGVTRVSGQLNVEFPSTGTVFTGTKAKTVLSSNAVPLPGVPMAGVMLCGVFGAWRSRGARRRRDAATAA
jgi:hypothetical protein